MIPADNSRPTLEDVAVRAGVSRGTVSRVVNDSAMVSHRARRGVREAILALGYVPNRAARTLVTRRTAAVAFVVSGSGDAVFDDPFSAATLRAASRELSARDRQLVLLWANGPQQHERAIRFLLGGHVDGAFLLAPGRDDPVGAALRSSSLPVVFSGRPWPADPGVHVVDHDNVGGAFDATGFLTAQGRRCVVVITGPLDQSSAVDRLAGWTRAVGADAAMVSRLAEDGGHGRPAGERAMTRLLDRVPELDAVFATSDAMAAGALRALHRAGRAVPDDVAVIGFDGLYGVGDLTDPPLTSVTQDLDAALAEMGRRLFSMIDRTEHVEPATVVLPVHLTRRSSA